MRKKLIVTTLAFASLSVAASGGGAEADAPVGARMLEWSSVEGRPTDRSIEPLRLQCAARTTDEVAGVRCAWSTPTSDRVAGLRLFRVAVGGGQGREVVFRTADVSVTEFVDAPVRTGVRYVYAVQGVSSSGRVIAQSRPVHVGVPADEPDLEVEVLRLTCEAADSTGETRVHIGCQWSTPEENRARTITLWRSVDGAARERVQSFAAPFATSYRDVVPAGTSRVVYAVIGTDGAGEIVARSRADGVAIPQPPATTLPRPIATDADESSPERARDVATSVPATSVPAVPPPTVEPRTPASTIPPPPTTTEPAVATPAADDGVADERAAGSSETVRQRPDREAAG